MSVSSRDERDRTVPALLTQGFRPFFLATALWAATALTIWIVMLTTGAALPSRFDPLQWHIHEMLFGFVMAAVAGFLLTAIPNWTGRPYLRGAPLAWLAGLWLIGRIDCLVSGLLPLWLSIPADLLFPVALLIVAAREIAVAGSGRNMFILVPVAVLGTANLLMHLEIAGIAVPAGLGWRLGLAAIVVLISVIGGRIIPAFTRNWLANRHADPLTALGRLPDGLALATLLAALFGWAFFPHAHLAGALLVIAAAVNLWRLARWRGFATLAEPLLLILHVGYGWVIAGAALLGLSAIDAGVPLSAGVHALAAGAIGTMILAVMTRATRGHTGRGLHAGRATVTIYALANAGALARIGAEFTTGWAMALLIAAAVLWISAFVLFVACYGRMLTRPRAA